MPAHLSSQHDWRSRHQQHRSTAGLIKASPHELNVMNPRLVKAWRERGAESWLLVHVWHSQMNWAGLRDCHAAAPAASKSGWEESEGPVEEGRGRVGSALGHSGRHPHTTFTIFPGLIPALFPLRCPTNGKAKHKQMFPPTPFSSSGCGPCLFCSHVNDLLGWRQRGCVGVISNPLISRDNQKLTHLKKAWRYPWSFKEQGQ